MPAITEDLATREVTADKAEPGKHVTRSMDFVVTRAPKGEKEYDHEFYASTGQIDRYGEIVAPKAFKATLDQYVKSNPVILFAHNHRNLPVGKTASANVTDKGLKVRIKWAPTELGQEIKLLYDAGFMFTLSVGFIPLKWVDHTEEERKKGAPWRTYTAVDLLEISAVPVPANPGATINNSAFEGRSPDFERTIVMASAADLEIEAVRQLYAAISKQDEVQNIVSVPFKSNKSVLNDDAPWNEPRERRLAGPLALVEMAAVVRKGEDDDGFICLDVHHDHEGRVSQKACVAIIARLNGDSCDYPADVRKEAYAHIVRHLTDDFGVASEHIAPLKSMSEDDVPATPVIELSPELKSLLGGISTGIQTITDGLKGVTDRLTALEGKQVQTDARLAALPASAPTAGAGAETPAPGTTKSKDGEDDESIVLDFSKEELESVTNDLATSIAQKLFGTPPKKKQ